MITLFRRLRQKLISSGSISKYLLYAIGEIMLVVIGILIALQVNNWNEERNRQNEEIHYLNALYKDFETAEFSFLQILGAVEEQLNHNRQFLTTIAEPVGNVPSDSIQGMIRKAFIDVPIGVEVTAYDDLLNSGKLAVLQSEELRRALSEFESANTLAKGYAKNAAEQWAGQVTEFFIKRLNVSTIYGSESDVHWDVPGIPHSAGYDKTPIIKRFTSDEEALWGRELANRIAIKNVLLEDSARSVRDVLKIIEQIYILIDESHGSG